MNTVITFIMLCYVPDCLLNKVSPLVTRTDPTQ